MTYVAVPDFEAWGEPDPALDVERLARALEASFDSYRLGAPMALARHHAKRLAAAYDADKGTG